jgi:hypothetical protein
METLALFTGNYHYRDYCCCHHYNYCYHHYLYYYHHYHYYHPSSTGIDATISLGAGRGLRKVEKGWIISHYYLEGTINIELIPEERREGGGFSPLLA